MASPQQKRWTVEDYLAYEAETDVKHEYYYGDVYAMAGGSENHALIMMSLAAHLYRQVPKPRCKVYQGEMKVKASESAFFYPDVMVVCGDRKIENNVLQNPAVIVEVLSPATEGNDRGKKFQEYRTLETLQEYLLVAQDRYHIEHWRRGDDGWLLTDYIGADAQFELQSIDCVLTLADVYEQVDFSQSTENDNE